MLRDESGFEARMSELRREAGPAAFAPGFTDRVMARLERQPSLADGLQRVFVRLAPLAAAAVLVLGAVNLMDSRASGKPFLDRVLELQEVDLATAYVFEVGVAANTEVGR